MPIGLKGDATSGKGYVVVNGVDAYSFYEDGSLDTPVVPLTTTTTLDDSYSGKIITCAGTFTITIGNRRAGFNCIIVNIDTGVITLAAGSGVTLHTKGDLVGIAEDEAVTVFRQSNNNMRAIGGLS